MKRSAHVGSMFYLLQAWPRTLACTQQATVRWHATCMFIEARRAWLRSPTITDSLRPTDGSKMSRKRGGVHRVVEGKAGGCLNIIVDERFQAVRMCTPTQCSLMAQLTSGQFSNAPSPPCPLISSLATRTLSPTFCKPQDQLPVAPLFLELLMPVANSPSAY